MGKRNGLDRQNVKAGENAVRDDMRETVIKNGIYRHYKGGIYEVTNIARHSESLEELVIYKNVVSEDCWARPVSMWNETIEQDGIKIPRFHFVTLSTRLCKRSHKIYESQPCPQSKSSFPRMTPQLG